MPRGAAVATDNFNRASLGATDWTQLNAAWANVQISASTVFDASASNGSNEAAAVWIGAGSFTADQYSEVTVGGLAFASINWCVGVIARASTDTGANRDFYFFFVAGTSAGPTYTTVLGKVVNGTRTVLNSAAQTWANGDEISIECEGTTIRGCRNGVALGGAFTVTDSDLATGNPGILANGNTALTGDDWVAGNMEALGGPAISGTSSATPSNGSTLTITGTAFGASQGAGGVTIGGIAQTVTAWADTTIDVTVARGTNKYGAAVNVVVTDNSLAASAPFALTSLQPQSGWAFVDLATPSTTAYNRLQAVPDLASGDQIAYESLSGAVAVATDATFTVASGVSAFRFEVWTPADGWGAIGVQTTPPQWYAPASADSYQLAAKVAEFQGLLNPQTWFGPIAVEKWFAEELPFTAGGPAGITGDLNITLGAVTLSAAATVPHAASLNATLGAVTLVGAATVPHTASLNATLGAVAVSGAATVPHTANLNATLGAVTMSGNGTLGSNITGALTVTLGAVTASAAGSIAISGTATPTLGAVTLNAAGTNGNGITGTLNATLGAVTVTAAGASAIAGTLNATLGAATLNGAAAIPHTGTLNVTLGAATLSATGGGLPAILGTLNTTLGAVGLTAAAQALIAGNLNVTLGAVTLSSGEPAIYSGGNAAIGLGLLAAGARIGNTRLAGQNGRIGNP